MPLSTPNSLNWKNLFIGSAFDPSNDQQAVSDNDLVGNASNSMMEAQTSGTGDATNYYFRARMGDSNPSTSLFLGLDLNRDGRIDVFIEANVKDRTPYISLHVSDPGKSGVGPSSTGWLNSSNDSTVELKISADNSYIAKQVSAGTNIDAAGGTDSWIQFGFRFIDLKAFAKNAIGFDNLSVDDVVSAVLFTSTGQTANGDIAGVNDSISADLAKTWAELGIFTTGSLDDLVTGELISPTVNKLSTSDTSPEISGTWGGENGGSDVLTIQVNGITYSSGNPSLTITNNNWRLNLPETSPGTYEVTATATRNSSIVANDISENELTIVAPGDTAAPLLDSSSPSDNATSVSVGSDLNLLFNENIVAGSGVITLNNSSGIQETYSLRSGSGSAGGSISIVGNQLTINPGFLLDTSTNYFLIIESTALSDLSGNNYLGISSSSQLNFSTAASLGNPEVPIISRIITSDADPVISGTWGGFNGGTDSLSISVNGTTYTESNGLITNGLLWSIQLGSLSDGVYSITASASRVGGGISTDTTTAELTIDTIPSPNIPIIASVEDNVEQFVGSKLSNSFLNDSSPLINGIIPTPLASNEFIEVYRNGTLIGRATTTDVNWVYQDNDLSDGSYEYQTRIVDLAGNEGELSESFYINVDTTSPTLNLTSLTISNDTGINTDFITTISNQTISLTLDNPLEDGDAIFGSIDGGLNWINLTNYLVGQNLSWSNVELNGSGYIEFKIQDGAGNESNLISQQFIVDNSVPTINISNIDISNDTANPDDFLTNTANQSVSGMLSDPLTSGDSLLGSLDGGFTWIDITSYVSGTSFLWPDIQLLDSGFIKLKVLNEAGNEGSIFSQEYQLDNTSPVFISAQSVEGGARVALLFNDDLLENIPTLSQFDLKIGSLDLQITGVEVVDDQIYLTLSNPIPSGIKNIKISYRSSEDINTSQVMDLAGNKVLDLINAFIAHEVDDSDGVDNFLEDSGKNNGDANGDGVLDGKQPFIVQAVLTASEFSAVGSSESRYGVVVVADLNKEKKTSDLMWMGCY